MGTERVRAESRVTGSEGPKRVAGNRACRLVTYRFWKAFAKRWQVFASSTKSSSSFSLTCVKMPIGASASCVSVMPVQYSNITDGFVSREMIHNSCTECLMTRERRYQALSPFSHIL